MTEGAQRGEALLDIVHGHGSSDALQWLSRGLPSSEQPFKRGVFFGFYSGAGRRFRTPDLRLTSAQRSALNAAGVLHPEVFSLDDLVRVVLLQRAMAQLDPSEHVSIAQEAFRKGDNAEQIALLRALPLLPEPERFVEVAVEACRTHVQDVFDAIACDNPFPARHFPEPNFNQLVMKALFTEVPVRRVVDWQSRNNPELKRMASDYAAERRAANRPVPEDVALITAPE